MFRRIASATMAATLALGFVVVEAQADHRKKNGRARAHDHYYAGPDFVKGVPGLRLFFGDYALTREEFDALYGDEEDNFDESYYTPESIAPARSKTKSSTRTELAPSQDVTTASISKTPAPRMKPKAKSDAGLAAAAAPSAGASALTCDKAGSIISGYGFQAVQPETCKGKVYAFNASRDGKKFAIKLDSSSGELTEVKKLQ